MVDAVKPALFALVGAALLLAACAHPSAVGGSAPAAATAAVPCSLGAILPGATADLPAGASFPQAEAPAAGVAPMSESAAIALAQRYQSADPPDLNAKAAAVEETYAQALLDIGEASGDPRIAPSRCTWVVTVDAPFAGPVPPRAAPVAHSRYTVLIDAATGRMEELAAPPA